MRKSILVAALSLVVAAAIAIYAYESFSRTSSAGVSTDGLHSDSPTALKVLFVGNSFTFYGPLPTVFGRLVKDGANRDVKIQMIAFPNAKLEEHEQKGEVARALANDGPWDYVVMQDQSRMAFDDPASMQLNATKLDARIHAAGAETILYMTWAELTESAREQAVITDAYERLGKELNARVAPVGRAWLAAGALRPKLYLPDGHHPTALGVYLTACVLYETLIGESPIGLPYPAESTSPASASDIDAIQRLAAQFATR